MSCLGVFLAASFLVSVKINVEYFQYYIGYRAYSDWDKD